MMVGKLLLQILLYSSILSAGSLRLVWSLPLLDSTSFLPDSSGFEDSRIIMAKLDQPAQAQALMDAVRDFGGSFILLVPPSHSLYFILYNWLREKRDPPDLGVGRSYTGQRAANILRSQAATNSAVGPGKRSEKVSVEHGFVM